MRITTIGALTMTMVAVVALSAPAAAQDCRIKRVGGAKRFSEPVRTQEALQAMFKEKEGEIKQMLGRAGWTGAPEDLLTAIAGGRASKQKQPVGTRFEWMLRRVGGAPELLLNECWGGAEPLDAWALDVESKGRRSHFVIPLACGNLALVGSEALPATPAQTPAKTEPQPPPRTEPPPPAPAPPPPPRPAPPPPPVAPPPETKTEVVVEATETPTWNFSLFAGYFFPEELDEDLTYGLRFGKRFVSPWGWEVSGSWFDVADSQGFSGQDVDADLIHVDFSFAYYPGDQNFSIFFGPGFASGNIDVPGTREEISDDVFSAHVGLGYEIGRSPRRDARLIKGHSSFFAKPDIRLRWYELEGFGADGGKDSQITYEAAIAFGWRFGGR